MTIDFNITISCHVYIVRPRERSLPQTKQPPSGVALYMYAPAARTVIRELFKVIFNTIPSKLSSANYIYIQRRR